MAETANRTNDRLYMDVARKLVAELVAGTFPIGSRLPAERELAAQYNVSRPTVREAIIALEVRGFVEVRIGSGIYVMRHPDDEDVPGYGMTAFELTEARLLIEGEIGGPGGFADYRCGNRRNCRTGRGDCPRKPRSPGCRARRS